MAKICPECNSTRIRRSRSKNLREKLEKSMTAKRLFRCHDCGWRGWLNTERHRSDMKQLPTLSVKWLFIVMAAGVVMGCIIFLGKLWRGE